MVDEGPLALDKKEPGHNAWIELADLLTLPKMQVRDRTDPATVKRYAQAMKANVTFPSVTVADVGGALVLIDGFHRVEAARSLHRHRIMVVTVGAASLKEARWLAAQANLKHGLHLKAKERRGSCVT